MDNVIIYTDGACSGNPGPGGWGAVLIYNEIEKEISGAKLETTNNEMEMTAVIKALELLKRPCKVDLYSDSAYVVNAFNEGWIENWIKNNWRTAKKEEVKNQDLWKTLIDLTNTHEVTFHKVKGHSIDKYNNRCDELATGAIKNLNNLPF